MRSLKWIVAILLGINLGVWLYLAATSEQDQHSEMEGRLPRVATLELVSTEPAQQPTEVAVAESSVPEAEASHATTAVVEAVPGLESARIDGGEGERASCVLVGWFDEESAAREALGLLRAPDQPSFIGLHERELALDDFYWVLVPPMESRQAAIAASRELSGRGIESYVIPSGEQENGVSLGLFRSRDSAEHLLQQRSQQNVSATLVILPRNRISYGLVFEGPLEAVELPEVAHRLSEDGRLQRIVISDCESVATAEKTP